MIASLRKIVWAAVAVACAFSGWVWLHEPLDVVSSRDSAVKPLQATASGQAYARNMDASASREPIVEAEADLFKVVSFLPPPNPVEDAPVATPPPPAPVAPPFPYRYLGRMLSVDGALLTYLARGEAIVPIHLHQVLDTDYRVDKLSDTELVITYLPLNEQTRIATRSAEN